MWPFDRQQRKQKLQNTLSARLQTALANKDAAERYDALRTLEMELRENRDRKGIKIGLNTLLPIYASGIIGGGLYAASSFGGFEAACVGIVTGALSSGMVGLGTATGFMHAWGKKSIQSQSLLSVADAAGRERQKLLDRNFSDIAMSPHFDRVREKFPEVESRFQDEIRKQLESNGQKRQIEKLKQEFEEKAKTAIRSRNTPPPPKTMLKLG